MHLSLSLVTVIIVLLHSISVVKGGIFSWNRTEVCVSARKLNTRYEDRIVQVDTISQIITMMMPSVLVLIEEYKEIDPDINAALFHCKYLLKEAKDELKHSRFGPAYTGCDRFLPPFSSQELLPIYEAIVDRLTSVQQWFRWKKQC
uniref:Uncharacterized protein n=1 Tax=Trichobilharzia regenti TaxID=157069 RepID=A0AA85IWS6_TRIRE|nr:unnamed protein product [Trichobilharzia regenti]